MRCTAEARVARYYDPTTAQFLTRDPIEQLTQQPYQYANGDPIDGSDPSGLCNKNPFSGGFWTQGNCLSDFTTYVYDTDTNWYSCHGGWGTFATIAIGSSLAAAPIVLAGPFGAALDAGFAGLEAEGGLDVVQWWLHLGMITAPATGSIGVGIATDDVAISQSASGCGCQ